MAAAVVTCFLRNRGEVLLLRRSGEVGTYPGRWAGVSGYVETDDPLEDARREVREETGLEGAELVRRGDAFEVDDGEHAFEVHPFLFDCPGREVETNYEASDWGWYPAPEILRLDAVPELWRSYSAVAPSVDSVAGDDEHGSSYVSVEALQVVRDAAATSELEAARDAARRLVEARPSMAAVGNRVARAADAGSADEMERRAQEEIRRAYDSDERAAEQVAELLGDGVVTLSRSGTVRSALERAEVDVVVAESVPGGEGRGVAEEHGGRLVPDSCVPREVARTGSVVVGADAVLTDGSVVNKVGSLAAALAAQRYDVRFLAAASTDKVVPANHDGDELANETVEWDGDAVEVFERVPADLVDVSTEEGVLDAEEIRDVAERHASYRERLEDG